MMSFYGLVISVTLLFCILQVSLLVSESQNVGVINLAYYQIAHSISSAMQFTQSAPPVAQGGD
jgi:hypothetical protein